MKIIKHIILLNILFSFLYSQWALWANPSLPVGNAQQGVGLGAGEMMITADYSSQYIDWMHSSLPDENNEFDHIGTLSTQLLNLRLTIGINDWWDVAFQSSFIEKRIEENPQQSERTVIVLGMCFNK